MKKKRKKKKIKKFGQGKRKVPIGLLSPDCGICLDEIGLGVLSEIMHHIQCIFIRAFLLTKKHPKTRKGSSYRERIGV